MEELREQLQLSPDNKVSFSSLLLGRFISLSPPSLLPQSSIKVSSLKDVEHVEPKARTGAELESQGDATTSLRLQRPGYKAS